MLRKEWISSMQPFTLRVAHLKEPSPLDIGAEVTRGDLFGIMGNTGSSTAAHSHLDLVKGYRRTLYRLHEIDFDRETIEQLGYFIDDELFKYLIVITAYFGDPTYLDRNGNWKMHPGYDVVPENRHYEPGRNFNMYWNRSKDGIVLHKGYDAKGYGYYILIGYEA